MVSTLENDVFKFGTNIISFFETDRIFMKQPELVIGLKLTLPTLKRGYRTGRKQIIAIDDRSIDVKKIHRGIFENGGQVKKH